ncbi:MAG: serine hydrolase domain-containing protein [Aquabacterium sp.]
MPIDALPDPAVAPAAAPLDAALLGSLDPLFADYLASAQVPGLVWGIVAGGRLVHVRGLGVQDIESRRPVTVDTLFRIASMTKAITAMTVLKLRDDGRLQLDALAETYVPEMRGWAYPTLDSPRIRVRDLLNHTAGFVTDDPWGDHQTPLPDAAFTQLLRDGLPFSRPPGTAMEYSNLGYALLGRIVANATGRPYADVVADTLLRPLGMDASGFRFDAAPAERRALGYRRQDDTWQREPDLAHGAFSPMGGLQTSARDYARWVAFLLDAWPARDAPDNGPVRRATVREMAQGSNFPELMPGRQGPAGVGPRRAAVYAMGLTAVADADLGLYLSHGGGYPGYGSYMMLLPEHGVGLFAFANRTYSGPARPVAEAALKLMAAGALKPRATAVSAALASASQAVVTIFGRGDIAAAGDVLAMNILLDRDAATWARTLAQLQQQAGTCDTSPAVVATGALSGRFTWPCAQGHIAGHVLLTPTQPPRIQEIGLRHQAP